MKHFHEWVKAVIWPTYALALMITGIVVMAKGLWGIIGGWSLLLIPSYTAVILTSFNRLTKVTK